MKNLFAAIFALLLPVVASAQFTVTGTVRDGQSKNPLPGAIISVTDHSVQATTNVDGKFRIDLPGEGTFIIKASYLGYYSVADTIHLNGGNKITIVFNMAENTILTEGVTVNATRASANSPTAFTNLNKADLEKNNSGRGFEYLLEQTPSTVVSSNAGAGVGYTSIRIRGSDASRTNVTVNGIPINDAEDQGVYFVDIPDIASSVDNVQIQRGVGTSTNGAGAFGASINIQTTTRRDSAYAEINSSAGSYGTEKNTVNVGTGLLGGHFTFDGRLSQINSDGYINRAFSHLKSYFLTGAYYGKRNVLRVNIFSGYEQTYQAWDGVPEDSVKAGNRRYNDLGLINSTGQFYKNQTDNYWQNYYQLLYDHQITDNFSFSGALFYTKGYGYYEEYRNSDMLSNYGVTPITVGGVVQNQTDLTRDLWLNNDFYGATYNLNYRPSKKLNLTLGGAWNEYKGAHYNDIEWTQVATSIPPNYEYSRDNATKTDFNIFARAEYHAGKFLFYGDMQYRHIYYSFLGFDQNLNNVQQAVKLDFFNPKMGVTYNLNDNSNVYASFAVGNHEPNRSDYTNSSPASRPLPETLNDFEAGYRVNEQKFSAGVNGFYMLYHNQLVLTGALDDVGEAIRTNVKDSYRAGIEVYGKVKIADPLNWALTASLSQNKVKNFQQYFFNYDNNTNVLQQYSKTDIAYSPDFVGSSTISYHPVKNGEIAFITKYVSRQYLDNTSTVSRSLDGYVVNDIRLNYTFKLKGFKSIGVGLLINNVLSEKYQSDGATYPDIEGGKVVNYNYWYTQAPVNFLASVSLKF